MDRTIIINDMWQLLHSNGKQSFLKRFSPVYITLPYESKLPFAVKRKIICPKQVNDTVFVHFPENCEPKEFFAGRKRIFPIKNHLGQNIYDITPSLKTGKTFITLVFSDGNAKGVFLSVKRDNAKVGTCE